MPFAFHLQGDQRGYALIRGLLMKDSDGSVKKDGYRLGESESRKNARHVNVTPPPAHLKCQDIKGTNEIACLQVRVNSMINFLVIPRETQLLRQVQC